MGNIEDYVRQETRDFDELPFGPADALALAQLTYDSVPQAVSRLDDLTARYGTLRDRMRAFDPRHPIASLRVLRRAPYEGPTLMEANALLHADSHADAHADAIGARRRIDGENAGINAEATGESTRDNDDQRHDNHHQDGTQNAGGHRHGNHRVNDVSFVDDAVTHGFYRTAARNPRYSDMAMNAFAERFDTVEQTQFAALTYRLPDKDGTLVIAFRGTDDSLVGWKEDFNMAFQYPVPAQVSAAEYVRGVARLWPGPIILTGHSKGGNLAVYAAMNAPDDVQERIRRIYSLDGPGFPHDVVHGEAYARVRERIEKIIPDSSIIGMVLETPERCTVVRSDAEGVMQHFAFSWQIEEGRFVEADDLADSSRMFNRSLNEWLAGLTQEQRERAVDALFSVLKASGADSFSQLMAGGVKSVADMVGRFVGLDGEDRRHLVAAARLLLTAALARNPDARRRNGGQDAAPAVTPTAI